MRRQELDFEGRWCHFQKTTALQQKEAGSSRVHNVGQSNSRPQARYRGAVEVHRAGHCEARRALQGVGISNNLPIVPLGGPRRGTVGVWRLEIGCPASRQWRAGGGRANSAGHRCSDLTRAAHIRSLGVVERLFHARIGQREPLLQAPHSKHPSQPDRRPTTLRASLWVVAARSGPCIAAHGTTVSISARKRSRLVVFFLAQYVAEAKVNCFMVGRGGYRDGLTTSGGAIVHWLFRDSLGVSVQKFLRKWVGLPIYLNCPILFV